MKTITFSDDVLAAVQKAVKSFVHQNSESISVNNDPVRLGLHQLTRAMSGSDRITKAISGSSEEAQAVTFKTLPNRHFSRLIGFSIYTEDPEKYRHVGTLALSSALDGDESRTVAIQLAKLIEGKDPIDGDLP